MIESHVVSLDLSRKLHELGVRKQSIFSWANDRLISTSSFDYVNYNDGNWVIQDGSSPRFESTEKIKLFFPAYLASEINKMLPTILKHGNQTGYLFYDFEATELSYRCIGHNEYGHYKYLMVLNFQSLCFQDKKECDAGALMLISLIKNNYVKIEDLYE